MGYDPDLMRIGEFSKAVGVSSTVIRGWHKRGVLFPEHISGSYRLYSPSQVPSALECVDKLCRRKVFLSGGVIVDSEASLGLSEFESYLFGVCCADGSLGGSLLLEMKDRDLIDAIAAHYGVAVEPHRKCFRITIPAATKWKFVSLGLCGGKGKNGFVIPNMSHEDFRHFLRGFFDGDGCVDIHDNKLRVRITGHFGPLGQVQNTLWSAYGMYLGWSPFKASDTCGNLESSKRSSTQKFYDLMYGAGGVFLERKKLTFDVFFDSLNTKVA